MRYLLLILLVALCGCARTANTFQISNAENSAIRMNDDGVYINPALLGFGKATDNITVNTSSNNDLTFEISTQAKEKKPGKAW